MAFRFGRGARASKATTPYMGPEIGFSQTQMHQGYVGGYSPLQQARSPKGMARLPMEHTSARQYADVPISQRSTVSRSMSPGETRSLLAKRGQLRGLETRGTVPEAGSRAMGRPVKVNAGGRPVSNGYGSMVNHRQAAAQAEASATRRTEMGLSGRGVRPNPHNAGGYRGMTREAYENANRAERVAVTRGRPGRVVSSGPHNLGLRPEPGAMPAHIPAAHPSTAGVKNPFNTFVPKAEGNNVQKAIGAIEHSKPMGHVAPNGYGTVALNAQRRSNTKNSW